MEILLPVDKPEEQWCAFPFFYSLLCSLFRCFAISYLKVIFFTVISKNVFHSRHTTERTAWLRLVESANDCQYAIEEDIVFVLFCILCRIIARRRRLLDVSFLPFL